MMDETDEIEADEEFMVLLLRGIKEVEEGKAIDWEQCKKDLGLDYVLP